MRIQLSEKDREKYGAPEWLDFDWNKLGLKIVDDLEYEAGLTIEDFENGLRRKGKNEQGEEVYRPRPRALVALAWMSLRIAGVHIPWSEFDISSAGLKLDPSSGKAEQTDQAPDQD